MTTVGKVVVLSPRGESYRKVDAVRLAAGLQTLSGKAVFLINNRRPNAKPLLEAIERALLREHAVGRTVTVAKVSAGLPVSEESLDQMAREGNAAIIALCC